MDKKKSTALILLDLSKAFDSNDHDRLLYKKTAMGASYIHTYFTVTSPKELSRNNDYISTLFIINNYNT